MILISGTLSDKRSLTFAMYVYGDTSWSVSQPVMIGYYLQGANFDLLNPDIEGLTEPLSNLEHPFYKLATYEIDTRKNPKTGMYKMST